MTQQSGLAKAIVLTAAYYGREISEAVLKMYIKDLSDLDETKCILAYDAWRKKPENKTFPLPAQIREMLNPTISLTNEQIAADIAGRIVGAVSKFGYSNPKEAREFIGDVGWIVVELRGGWNFICRNLGLSLNPSTFEAQARKQVEFSLKSNQVFGSLDSGQKKLDGQKRHSGDFDGNSGDYLGLLQEIRKKPDEPDNK